MYNLLRKFKQTFFWKKIIEYFFYPTIHFFWSYVLNFEAKILYFLWNTKKKKYFDLNFNDKRIINGDLYFREISKKILDETEKLVKKSKDEILSLEYKEKLLQQNLARAEKPYQKSLYNKLSQNLINEIINFASSEKMITTAAKYMKIFPILTRVDVGHIIPRNDASPRAAMLWHKDTFGFKSLDFFMIITDVNEDNGPLICLEKKIAAGVLKSFTHKKFRSGERGKVDDEEFNRIFQNYNTIKLEGQSGNGLFIDSFSTYHKGGFCKKRDRIMLRFCYQSVDAICDETFYSKKNHYEFNGQISKNSELNIFLKYFYFKKPNLITKAISRFLIKFYSLIEYKF